MFFVQSSSRGPPVQQGFRLGDNRFKLNLHTAFIMSPPPPLHQPIFRKYPSFSIYRRINEFHENTVKVKIILNKTGSVSDLLFQNFDSSTDFTVTPRYTRYDFFFLLFFSVVICPVFTKSTSRWYVGVWLKNRKKTTGKHLFFTIEHHIT